MTLQIDNSAYAGSNIIFGRVLPGLVVVGSILTLASLFSQGLGEGTFIPLVMTAGLIVLMAIVYARRGKHPAVTSIEISREEINATFLSGRSCYGMDQVRSMEYEGVRNPSRVDVRHAPFPKDGERVLVITLADQTELRVRVRYEHDAALKAIAASVPQ